MARDTWERWDIPSNFHMFAYCARNAARYVRDYPGRVDQVTAILNDFKKAWAEDMRVSDPVPSDAGLDMWRDNMLRAERAIIDQLGPPKDAGE